MPTTDATTTVCIDQSQILDWAWALLSAAPDVRIKVARGREYPKLDPGSEQVAIVWLESVSVQQSNPGKGREDGTFNLSISADIGEPATHTNAMEFISTWVARRIFTRSACTGNQHLSIRAVSYSSVPHQVEGNNPKIRSAQMTFTLEVGATPSAGFDDKLVA